MFEHHRTISRLLLIAMLILGSLFVGCSKLVSVAESEETLANWQQGRVYQAEGRYVLARQQYLLAVAACNTADACAGLQRDLEKVNLLIKTMR